MVNINEINRKRTRTEGLNSNIGGGVHSCGSPNLRRVGAVFAVDSVWLISPGRDQNHSSPAKKKVKSLFTTFSCSDIQCVMAFDNILITQSRQQTDNGLLRSETIIKQPAYSLLLIHLFCLQSVTN
jgi:hypothetical protein